MNEHFLNLPEPPLDPEGRFDYTQPMPRFVEVSDTVAVGELTRDNVGERLLQAQNLEQFKILIRTALDKKLLQLSRETALDREATAHIYDTDEVMRAIEAVITLAEQYKNTPGQWSTTEDQQVLKAPIPNFTIKSRARQFHLRRKLLDLIRTEILGLSELK